MIRPVWTGLILVAVGLGVLLRAELIAPRHGDVAVPAVQPLGPAATAATDRSPELADTARARPLFSQNRRPPALVVTDARIADGAARLTAIVLSPEGRHAIFAPAGEGRPITLSEGDRLGGEIIRTIAQDAVIVDGPAGRRVLHTQFDLRSTRATNADPLALPGMITGVLPSAAMIGGQPSKVP